MKRYTLEQAAREVGWHKSQVSRWVKRLGFGMRNGNAIELNANEVRCLFWLRRAAKPGNPEFRR